MKSEFDFIETVRRQALPRLARVGIGDDCAVIPKDSKMDLVITADLLVEEIDFRLDWTTPEFLGHKALAVSLSDIAAMGGKPVWAMLSIGVPAKIWKTDFVERFYDGWLQLAKKFDVELVGGDVSKTPDKIVVDSIAAGEVKKNRAILRSTASAGDYIFVTGTLGGAGCGLKLLESGKRYGKDVPKPLERLLLRQLKPDPQTEIGRILGENKLASAMIDLSDGLSSDLSHLCRESRIGARIFAEKIPADENLRKIESGTKNRNIRSQLGGFVQNRLDLALNGGEDFELLFTVPRKKFSRLENKLKNYHFSLIGEASANDGIIELIEPAGTRILQPRGFRHF